MESRVVQEKTTHRTSSATIARRKMRLTGLKTRLRTRPPGMGTTGSLAMNQLLQVDHNYGLRKQGEMGYFRRARIGE
jgi:hypothetical protein